MKCPHCKDKDLVMSERKGVEIDYCPECRGIWLDKGELDKILDRSQKEEAQASAQSAQRPQQQTQYTAPSYGDGYKYKRKKSFFEELFD
ncbi:TFIIB-type zinc ribbon-containing protein [Bdellovibrio sp. GT3]|uniref:TFIIB-type zinc ribbon-containing protein n=1 Tax=Bdellovibrio sp. GT3 TaxID=3136282 RepID=UPI0030F0964C